MIRRPGKVRLFQLFLVIALAVTGIVFVRRHGLPHCRDLQEAIGSFGSAAPLVYIAISVAASLIFIPRTPLVIAAGMIFGIPAAVALDLFGSALGATAGFFLARYLARAEVERSVEKSGLLVRHPLLAELVKETKEHGLSFVLFIRIVHFFPFGPMNYLCGVLPVRYRNYLVGTILGLVPGTLALVYSGNVFGCAILEGTASLPREIKVKMAIGMGLLTTLSVVPIVLGRRHARKMRPPH